MLAISKQKAGEAFKSLIDETIKTLSLQDSADGSGKILSPKEFVHKKLDPIIASTRSAASVMQETLTLIVGYAEILIACCLLVAVVVIIHACFSAYLRGRDSSSARTKTSSKTATSRTSRRSLSIGWSECKSRWKRAICSLCPCRRSRQSAKSTN